MEFKMITLDALADIKDELTKLYDASNAAESAYRTAKAAKFVSLSTPPEGTKKPSESMILAMIDSDPAIISLREAAAKAAAELDVAKMIFKAEVALVSKNG